jgi:signal transduction histidine kinase
VVAATALGGLRINESLSDMQQLEHMQLLTNMTRQATELAAALQNERDKTAGPLANGVPANAPVVKAETDKTDRVRTAFLRETGDVELGDESDQALENIRGSLTDIASGLIELPAIRSAAYKNQSEAGNSQTVSAYSALINSLLDLSQDMAQATSSPEMIQRTRALAAFSSAKEYASIQRAIIAASLPDTPENPKPGTTLRESDRLFGKAAKDNEAKALGIFQRIYGAGATELTGVLTKGSPDAILAEGYADKVLGTEKGITQVPKRSYMDWSDQASVEIEAMKRIEATLLSQMDQKARELKTDSERSTIISGAVILLVLGVSLVGAFVVSRSMIRSLRRLQDTATRVAQDRLPELVKQLSESDPQDVDTSVESVGVHSRDEIGRVAAAFDDVHREAVRLAAEQALLRGNVNAMFTNLSRRSQGLIQRQLSLISELEAREADPDQLSSLFKLDHLATRMRRNGENLLVLAGEEPGRRWTRPVPLVDVLRAAASEVEQYERIELSSVPSTEVAGRVVNDLVHLLAELLENATSFSSPQTKVRVTGHALPDGRVLVEIHDTGIGLSPEDLSAINERLAAPPTVDVSVSRRMGLFVVGRLSLRHGIRIQLRPSDSGGTTALVMLPVDVAQGGKKLPGKPGGPGLPGGQGGAPQMPAGPGARPGLPAGPGAGGGPGSRPGAPQGGPGLLGGGDTPRREVGAGSGPRAALPGRTPGAGLGNAAPAAPAKRGGLAGAFGGGRGGREDVQQSHASQGNASQGNAPAPLPRAGGPRAELPGGNPAGPQRPAPQAASWGAQQNPDAPRGHEEAEDRQGPGATAEFDRPDFNGPPPGSASATGQFERPDVRQDPASPGPFERPDVRQNPAADSPFPQQQQQRGFQDPAATGQFPQADTSAFQNPATTGQFERPDVRGPQGPGSTGQFPQVGRGSQDPAATGSYERPDVREPQGGSTTGQHRVDPYDTGQHQVDPYDTGQHQVDPYSTGQHQVDPYDTGQHRTGQYQGGQQNAPYETGRQDRQQDRQQGQYESGQYDSGQYGTGQYERPGAGAVPAPPTGLPQPPNAPRPRGPESGQGGQGQQGGQGGQGQQGGRGSSDFGAPRPVASLPSRPSPQQAPQQRSPQQSPPQRPARPEPQHQQPQQQDRQPQQHSELPPAAGPGDGRTPLFDTLESNWFHGEQPGGPQAPQGRPQHQGTPSVPQQPTASAPERDAEVNWRPSPNDELVRQAERVRKPAAGGVTTSGLPRRVPKANLVPGTAQEQNHQTGPQVSRAPDDVRGRLTNLRRGIQQGRQAGSNGTTGSFPAVDPTHQQER